MNAIKEKKTDCVWMTFWTIVKNFNVIYVFLIICQIFVLIFLEMYSKCRLDQLLRN